MDNEQIKRDVTEEIEVEVVCDEQKEVKDNSVKGKILGVVKGAKDKVSDGINWVKENPDEAAMGAYAAASIGITGLLVALGIKANNEAKNTVYSDDIDEFVKLNKELSNSDKVELDYRVKTGQTKIEALNDMGYIKRNKKKK